MINEFDEVEFANISTPVIFIYGDNNDILTAVSIPEELDKESINLLNSAVKKLIKK